MEAFRMHQRPLVLPPKPAGVDEWRAKLARMPDADEIDAAKEFVFRARDGYEFAARIFNIRRRWRKRGVDDESLACMESRWRSVAARGEEA